MASHEQYSPPTKCPEDVLNEIWAVRSGAGVQQYRLGLLALWRLKMQNWRSDISGGWESKAIALPLTSMTSSARASMFHISGLETDILGTNGPSLMGHQYKEMPVILGLQWRFTDKCLLVFYRRVTEMESTHENIFLLSNTVPAPNSFVLGTVDHELPIQLI